MKKFVSIIAILLMLSLAACSNQDTPSAADNPSNTQTESNTIFATFLSRCPRRFYRLPESCEVIKWYRSFSHNYSPCYIV